MKVVLVHNSLPVGGAEILRELVAKQFISRGVPFNICLISGGGVVAGHLAKMHVPIASLSCSRSIYNPFTTVRVARYFCQVKPTIVHSSQFNSNFHTRLAARLAGVPVVICEEHGIYHWKHWWHRLADRLLANWCDRIIAVSQAVKDFNINRIGVTPQKIQVLHNCLDTDRSGYTRTREEVRAEFGIAATEFVVGHVGTLRSEKGHDVLLLAFASFCKVRPAKLLLVGDGPLKSSLLKQVDDLCLGDRVLFAGTRSDVPDLHKAMDLFAFPSRNEALGIALLEAMYSGLPVVAARTGGIPEIIKDGETGLLVPAEDSEALGKAMLRIAEDRELGQQLGRAAYEYSADNHSPQAYADRLLAIYAELRVAKGLA